MVRRTASERFAARPSATSASKAASSLIQPNGDLRGHVCRIPSPSTNQYAASGHDGLLVPRRHSGTVSGRSWGRSLMRLIRRTPHGGGAHDGTWRRTANLLAVS